MNTQKPPITTKDLTFLGEMLKQQALAATKAKTYAGYMQDPSAKTLFTEMAQHHTQCFDTINQYLQSR